MNILISINKPYMTAAEVMLASLANKTSETVDVYLLNKDLSKEDTDSFANKLKNDYDVNLYVVEVPDSFLDDFPIMYPFSMETYYRIIGQFILPKELDRILWLDSDIAVLGDLSEFYNQDFDGAYLVACPDVHSETDGIKKVKEKLGLPCEHVYFNAGVLLMNLQALRENTNLDDIRNCANNLKDKLTYLDQDILNVLYDGKIKYADYKIYNCQILNSNKKFYKNSQGVVILHFIGHRKPWHYKFLGKHHKLWWQEAKKIQKYKAKKLRFKLGSICYKTVFIPYNFIKNLFKKNKD